MSETTQEATQTDPGAPPPIPEANPIFAGADPIVEENQGAIDDFYDKPAPTTPPEPPASPAPAQPAGEANGQAETAAAPASAPGNTGEASSPPEDPQQPEPAAAAPEPPETPPEGQPVEGEAPPAAAQPGEPTQVPSFRLAQESARRRAAEARAQELEAQLQQQQGQQVPPQVPGQAPAPVAPQNNQQAAPQHPTDPVPEPPKLDLGDDPKQMFDKVLDGDLNKATELFQDMMQRAVSSQPAQQPQQATPHQDQVAQLVQQQMAIQEARRAELEVVNTLEQQVPEFNPQSDKYNKDLVQETLSLQRAYMNDHYTAAEAMDRAAEAVLRLNEIQRAPVTGLRPSEQPAHSQSPSADPATVQQKLAAAQAQPPSMPPGQPERPGLIDINSLTEEEFDALPDTTVARMRGDIV